MKKGISWLVFGLIIGLLVGSMAGYLYANNYSARSFRGPNNFQLSEDEKNEVISTFNNNSSSIESYCQENMNKCVYYCREIDNNNSFCSQLNMSIPRSPPQK